MQIRNRKSRKSTKAMIECMVKKIGCSRTVNRSIFIPINGIRFRNINSIINKIIPGNPVCKSGMLGGISEMMQKRKYRIKRFRMEEKCQFFSRALIIENEDEATFFQ